VFLGVVLRGNPFIVGCFSSYPGNFVNNNGFALGESERRDNEPVDKIVVDIKIVIVKILKISGSKNRNYDDKRDNF